MNVVAYDRVRGETRDAIRSMSAQARENPGAAGKVFSRTIHDPIEKSLAQEQARRVSYQAELSRLDLEERLGKLMPVDEVSAARGARPSRSRGEIAAAGPEARRARR